MYFEECTGASVGAGDEVSGVGESEGVVDGGGEFWLFLAQHTTPCVAMSFPQRGFDKS